MSKSDPDLDLASLPGLVLHDNEPVFSEPWQAQAFAMVISLHRKGAFTWQEWADALSREIHGDEQILNAMNKLLCAFVTQKRMKLSAESYKPCYKIIR